MLTSTLGSANQAPQAVVKLSSLQPCSGGGQQAVCLTRAVHAPILGTDCVSQSQPPLLTAADIRLCFKHQLRAVCHRICRAFLQSRESLHFPGTFNTAVRASLGMEHTAGLGWEQTGWEVGIRPGAPLPQRRRGTLAPGKSLELCNPGVLRRSAPAMLCVPCAQSLLLKHMDLAGLPTLLFTLGLWRRH